MHVPLRGVGSIAGGGVGCGRKLDRFKSHFLTGCIQHGLSSTGTAACYSQRANLFEGFPIAYAAGRFDLYSRGYVSNHQLQILDGCSAAAVTGAGLDPVRFELATDLAQADFVRVLQVRILKDDFHFATGLCAQPQ